MINVNELMKRENNFKLIINWIEEIWEEIQIQFYGITGAIMFFILLYVFFHPLWMRALIEVVKNIKLSP